MPGRSKGSPRTSRRQSPSRPLTGDPATVGVPTFVVGSVLLGLALINYAPAAGGAYGSSGLDKAAGIVVFAFAAVGACVFAGSLSVATGGRPFPLGRRYSFSTATQGSSRPASFSALLLARAGRSGSGHDHAVSAPGKSCWRNSSSRWR